MTKEEFIKEAEKIGYSEKRIAELLEMNEKYNIPFENIPLVKINVFVD